MKEHRGISRAVRLINSILDNGLVLLLLLGLAYGCYALWDSQNLAQEATAEQYAVYKPQEDTLGFAELQALNEDVIGWITVYGTPIDYPVVQGEDNWEYINKSAEGTYSLTGAIFADASCDPDFRDFNTILYGHNMVPNVMFGSIKEFNPSLTAIHMAICIYRIETTVWRSSGCWRQTPMIVLSFRPV